MLKRNEEIQEPWRLRRKERSYWTFLRDFEDGRKWSGSQIETDSNL